MIPLRDLLSPALKRARVTKTVSASQVVSTAEDFLSQVMGPRKQDARAVSYLNGILTIDTLHSAASQFLREYQPELISRLSSHHPEQPVKQVRFRVVHRFRKADL